MAVKFLQANLNHASQAQNLFFQSLAERGTGLAIVAEPYKVPMKATWLGDNRGSAAIGLGAATKDSPPLQLIGRGDGFVAAKWGPITAVSCYAPPRWSLADFDLLLERVGDIVRDVPPASPLIVAGDFNAKSPAWGESRQDRRGVTLVRWVNSLGLYILNVGRASTCIRPQGESIVDITIGSDGAKRLIQGWRVVGDSRGETLSDHQYIEYALDATRHRVHHPPREGGAPRWALTKLDPDKLEEALMAVSWGLAEGEGELDIHQEVEWLRGVMRQVCDAAMPRVTTSRPRRAVYWWTEEIAQLRRSSVQARRALSRIPRRGDQERREEALAAYRAARCTLSAAIRKSRASCWDELLTSLNTDPWGRPYKIVLKKYGNWAPPATESLDPPVLRNVVDTLFPLGVEGSTLEWGPGLEGPHELTEDEKISSDELRRAVKRVKSGKAPGPDGVPGKIWVRALDFLGERLRHLFNECLRQSAFPQQWKRAKLVLLPKEGKEAGTPSAYRPICLLDEVGKIFERIIASRLVQHLSREGDLHEEQYGFREGRSTVDAVKRVRSLAEAAVTGGGVAMAVSLDIANAFNTLPWDTVGDALVERGVPGYLVEMVRQYFRDRHLEFVAQNGLLSRREIRCGVPQGSVLGPLLWNLAYNRILCLPLPRGCHAICYADDTLVVAEGDGWGDAAAKAEMAVAAVVRGIVGMGLRVATKKTEAIYFYGRASGRPPETRIRVGDTSILVGDRLKYLGLLLDGKWRFGHHFDALTPRVERFAAALGRLLPNLGGPDGRIRRIYMGTVNSVALYGCPVWAADLAVMRHAKDNFRRVQRSMAARVARAYRTVSGAAAMVLAGWPPLDLLATMYAEIYQREREIRGITGQALPPRAKKIVRLQARQSMIERWNVLLSDPTTSGQRTVEAVRPCLAEWLDRAQGEVSYRVTQVLTGHGCFGEYLCRILKERTTACHHCEEERDTAQHTLAECPAWDDLRRVLCNVVGNDLSLPVLITKMIGDERSWKAVASFCEQVMTQKEAAERVRRREAAEAEAAAAAAAAAEAAAATDSEEEDVGEQTETDEEDATSSSRSVTSPISRRLRPRHSRGGETQSPPSQGGR